MNDSDPAQRLKQLFMRPLEHPFFWIILVILIVYAGTLFYDIVYLDDNVLVVEHYPFNKSMANMPQAFQEDIFRSPIGAGSFYRPIERLTFILDAQFGKGSIIFMSHLSNLFLHILSICLLFILLLKLRVNSKAAFLLSLIFGVHPLTAQTVAFIAGRNDSLLAIFIFPALIFFLKYLETLKRKYFFWHLIFFMLALFTKETAAVLPFVCGAYVFIFINFRKLIANVRPNLYLLAGWGSALVFWFLVRREVLHNFIGNANYHIALSIYKNLPALIPALGKIIFPFELSVFPVMKDMSLAYGLAALAFLAIWFALAKNKNYRLIAFGTLWFFLFIILTLVKSIDSMPEFSENRIYLPMFGFIFIILGLGTPRFLETPGKIESNSQDIRKKIMLVAGMLLIVIFSSVTMYRNQYYKDKISFWRNAVETSPSFAFNHNNLGAMNYLDKKFDEAEAEFRKALEINPKERMAHNNLGLIYLNRKEFEKAEEEFNKELEINPYYDNAYANKGLLYYKMGKTDEALNAWKKALEMNPIHTESLYNLFAYYYQKQDKENAVLWASVARKRGIPLLPEMQKILNPFSR
jgi:tetratricopeptide (TPR) repeat protein